MSDGSNKSRRTATGRPFVPGDPRINRKGRPRLSQAQREFREKLHKMEASVLKSVKALVEAGEPSVINKLIEKLAGRDEEVLNLKVEEPGPDLSKLSREELKQWRALAARATVAHPDDGGD